jgi:4-hydroxybenzoate polyprenyltransferase
MRIPLYGTYGCWRSNWFYLSNVILKPSFAAVFILIAATLYLYATSLKQILIVGNTIVQFYCLAASLSLVFLTYYPQ